MIELKRTPKVQETLKIGDKKIDIKLDVEKIAMEFFRRINDTIAAEQAIRDLDVQKSPEKIAKAIDAYSTALVSLFVCVFGEDATNAIVKFYENDYMEMQIEVLPVITEKIMPAMREGMNRMRKAAAQQYKNSKRGRIVKRGFRR